MPKEERHNLYTVTTFATRQSLFVWDPLDIKAALYTIVPRGPFFLFVHQNFDGYKNAVECLLQ